MQNRTGPARWSISKTASANNPTDLGWMRATTQECLHDRRVMPKMSVSLEGIVPIEAPAHLAGDHDNRHPNPSGRWRMPVTRLVAPGPEVPKHTPTRRGGRRAVRHRQQMVPPCSCARKMCLRSPWLRLMQGVVNGQDGAAG